MTIEQFISTWLGKKADWDGAYGGQCVDLARFYWHQVLGINQPRGVVGAGDFWTNYDSDPVLKNNFTRIANTPDFVPVEGDTAIWNKNAGGGFGHIAIVVRDDHTKDYFHSFDQNWSKISYCEIVKHNYKNLYGVLRPKKELEMADMMQIEKSEFERLITKLDNQDKIIAEITATRERYKSERDQARSERDNYAEENKGLNTQIELLKKDISSLNSELEACQNQVPETPSEEDFTSGFTPTGRKIIEVQGDKTIETSYAVKEN